eukprot:1956028-Amphidinium_carterae.3
MEGMQRVEGGYSRSLNCFKDNNLASAPLIADSVFLPTTAAKAMLLQMPEFSSAFTTIVDKYKDAFEATQDKDICQRVAACARLGRGVTELARTCRTRSAGGANLPRVQISLLTRSQPSSGTLWGWSAAKTSCRSVGLCNSVNLTVTLLVASSVCRHKLLTSIAHLLVAAEMALVW